MLLEKLPYTHTNSLHLLLHVDIFWIKVRYSRFQITDAIDDLHAPGYNESSKIYPTAKLIARIKLYRCTNCRFWGRSTRQPAKAEFQF